MSLWLFSGINYVKQTGDQLSSSCIVQSGTAVWKLNGDPNITEPNVFLIGESGILNYTLVLSDINSSDAGVYECFSKKTIVENFTVAVISSMISLSPCGLWTKLTVYLSHWGTFGPLLGLWFSFF